MSLLDTPRDSVLNPGVRPREAWAWAMYDFANSGYTTVVITAVFNAYFVRVVAGDAPWATLAWTATLAVSYLLLIVLNSTLSDLHNHAGNAYSRFRLSLCKGGLRGICSGSGPGQPEEIPPAPLFPKGGYESDKVELNKGRVNPGHGCPGAAPSGVSQGRACTALGVGPTKRQDWRFARRSRPPGAAQEVRHEIPGGYFRA